MYTAVYAFVRHDNELYSLGLCPGNSAPACSCKRHCGRHLSQLDLEFLRCHDHANVTQLAGLEGILDLHVFELLVHSAGGKLFIHALLLALIRGNSTSATLRQQTSHSRRLIGCSMRAML
jgi:hypothetical protein